MHGFQVEGGEDIFRFYLLPEPFSILPKITKSVLKTRSTLSIHRVNRYLAKRMINDNIISLDSVDNFEEGFRKLNIKIVCNNQILNQDMQLKEVFQKHWADEEEKDAGRSDELLVLYYSRYNEQNETEIQRKQRVQTRIKFPPKPPQWVPDSIAYDCCNCGHEFSFWIRIHHCRACGKAFCARCSSHTKTLLQYCRPVRVCDLCNMVD